MSECAHSAIVKVDVGAESIGLVDGNDGRDEDEKRTMRTLRFYLLCSSRCGPAPTCPPLCPLQYKPSDRPTFQPIVSLIVLFQPSVSSSRQGRYGRESLERQGRGESVHGKRLRT
jgi:hypothetical protein